jgi:antibiotic biosynthesis monooxygenase (ABM) superfamily enzyme
MWLASFLGAYPLVLLSLMTYVMMPVVTRLLAGWLQPS